MKHSLFKGLFFTTFLLAFVVGCGKDGGGGGGGGNKYTSNPIQSGQGNENISSSAIQGYNVLVNWKNRLQANPGQERPLSKNGLGYARGVVAVQAATNPGTLPDNCKNYGNDWFPIIFCKENGQTSQPTVTPISVIEKRCTAQTYVNGTLRVSSMAANSLTSSGCSPTGSSTVYNISQNALLNQILSFQKGKILRIYSQYSGVYVIEVGNKVPEGYSTPAIAAYVIDTNIHSIYNPVTYQFANSSDQITTIYEQY